MDRAASGSARKVGPRLLAARERRNLERIDAARGAGVPLRFATMLEEGTYPLIADPAYLVPYLRRYARFLGLEPDALVLAFHEENDAADRAAAFAMLSSVEEAREERRRFRKLLTFAAVTTAVLGAGFYARSLGITVEGVVSRLPIRGVTDAVASWTSSAWPRLMEREPAPHDEPVSGPEVALAERPAGVTVEPGAGAMAAPVADPTSPSRLAAPESTEPAAPAATGAADPPQATAMPATEPTAAPTPEPTAVPTPVPTPAEVALRVAPPPAAPVPTAVPRRQHRLELTATARQVWVWVSVDGSRRRAIELRRGGKVEFKASREIVLSLDDAGGVIASFDGRPLEPLGRLGEARRNLRFPPR